MLWCSTLHSSNERMTVGSHAIALLYVAESESYDVRCDLSAEFEELFPVKSFDTFEEFSDRLQQFQDVRSRLLFLIVCY